MRFASPVASRHMFRLFLESMPLAWNCKKYLSFLVFALWLAVAGPALAQSAQCNVALSSILPNNVAILTADCCSASMSSITWMKDGIPLTSVPISPPTVAELTFTTLLTIGTHSYAASGTATSLGSSPIASPRAATMLSADGQVVSELALGDKITMKRARRTVRLMHLAGSSFSETLRCKLHWRGASL